MAQMYPPPPTPMYVQPGPPQRVTITNFNMPFWALTGFLIKFAFASIPAVIVLSIVFSILGGIFFGIMTLIGGSLGALFYNLGGY